MESGYDPNVPDCTEGDFFCKLCLASMNSEQMWSSHIVGRRHIKNVQKYPNGLPKRRFSEDEDSYDRPAKIEKFEKDIKNFDGHSSEMYREDYYYEDSYYNSRPNKDYVPEIRPNVIFDYEHKKKFNDEIQQQDSKECQVAFQGGKNVNVDSLLNSIKYDSRKNSYELVAENNKKDDFFEKLIHRELAKDLAKELAKNDCFLKEIQDKSVNKDPLTSGITKKSQRIQNEKHADEKYDKEKPDIIDLLHKYNDDNLFKECDKNSEKSLSKKSAAQSELNYSKIDPDKLTSDVLDNLLSSYLKPKVDLLSKETKASPMVNNASLDDPKVIAEKLETLPTKVFLQLIYKKLKKIDLKDSDELKMLLIIISQAQEVVCKKLPSHLQSVLKVKMSLNDSKKTEANVQNTTVSQNCSVASISSQVQNAAVSQNCTVPSIPIHASNREISQNYSIPSTSQMQNTIVPCFTPNTAVSHSYPIMSVSPQTASHVYTPVSSSPLDISNSSAICYPIQAAQGIFPVLSSTPNSVYPSAWQNHQANNFYKYSQMMNQNRYSVPSGSITYQSKQGTPSTNVNSLPGTFTSQQSSKQLSSVSLTNLPASDNVQEALQKLNTLMKEYKESRKESEKKEYKESKKESKKTNNNIQII